MEIKIRAMLGNLDVCITHEFSNSSTKELPNDLKRFIKDVKGAIGLEPVSEKHLADEPPHTSVLMAETSADILQSRDGEDELRGR